MGIVNPVSSEEDLFDNTNKRAVDTIVSIVDDDIRIKEEQLNDTIVLEEAKIANQQAIEDSKATNQRTIIALQTATNSYLILTEKYIKDVQALLMSAKEYALTIEEKEIALALLKAEVAEEKADVRIAEIDMRIDLEEINRKFVEIDVLKAELDVAKANVRLVMTQIEIDEAELKVIQARVDKAMMAVEKVTLEADVALVFADIAVRQLTETKYNIESAEIAAGYAWISDKLQSIIDILNVRQDQLIERINHEDGLLEDETESYNAKTDNLDIQYEEAQSNERVQDYEESQVAMILQMEEALKDALQAVNLAYNLAKTTGALGIDTTMVTAEGMVTKRKSTTKTYSLSDDYSDTTIIQRIE